MRRLKANYLWGNWTWGRRKASSKMVGVESRTVLYAIGFSGACMYYSAFRRRNRCPVRQPSASWTLWCIRDTPPFTTALRSYFSAGGKLYERARGYVCVCVRVSLRGFHLPLLQRKVQTPVHKRVWLGRNCCGKGGGDTFTCLWNYSGTSGVIQMLRWRPRGMLWQTGSSWEANTPAPLKGKVIYGRTFAPHACGDDSSRAPIISLHLSGCQFKASYFWAAALTLHSADLLAKQHVAGAALPRFQAL